MNKFGRAQNNAALNVWGVPGPRLLKLRAADFFGPSNYCSLFWRLAGWLAGPRLDSSPYQEAYDHFVRWLHEHFGLHNFIINTSDIYCWSFGNIKMYHKDQCRLDSPSSPSADMAAAFLELLLYGKENEVRFLDLLLQTLGTTREYVKAMGRPWRVAILLHKTTPDFQKWLDAELAYIRSEEINLDLFLILLADAWPAP